MPTMVHPELPGQHIEVTTDAVPFHLASGWVTLDGKAEEAAAEEAQAEADLKAENDAKAREAVAADEKKAAAGAKAKTAASKEG